MTNSKLASVKKVALDSVLQSANEGISENLLYSILYDYDKEHKVFEYGIDEITPASIVDNLIFKGFIIKVYKHNLTECRIYLDEHFMPE